MSTVPVTIDRMANTHTNILSLVEGDKQKPDRMPHGGKGSGEK